MTYDYFRIVKPEEDINIEIERKQEDIERLKREKKALSKGILEELQESYFIMSDVIIDALELESYSTGELRGTPLILRDKNGNRYDVSITIEKMLKYIKSSVNSNNQKMTTKEMQITWKDDRITTEKADSISFDKQKVNIKYKDEVTVIPLKNVKKLKFANLLLKTTYDWNWNFKTYEDSTSDDLIPMPIRVWYKYTSRTDTSGNPITY